MPISISTGRKMQMFLLDLLYPNRCPCCNCSISWREYLCEACRQEVTAEPADAFCPLCGKLPRDCFCGTGLSYDRAAILTEYTGAARAGVLSMKSAASLHFGRSGCHIHDHNCNEITLKRTHTRLISDTDNGPPERKPT